ncbi:BppU family phage baseplate upper protein [Cohnella sp. WQ 127256]|uniref:BppU family phage baseplate upper protein n=1 Tax=Cohnella sp. WQ 127256 TaxID=2938790 RepID=UPI00211968AE|nr:BppU family phage baseplate upper protein [Cohnella sp. WQ 127256]
MSNIVVGDNGTMIDITVMDDVGAVDLTTTTSIVAHFIRADKTTFNKPLSIVDAINGRCSTTLLSEDLLVSGGYTYQVTVNFSNGDEFSNSPPVRFIVGAKL